MWIDIVLICSQCENTHYSIYNTHTQKDTHTHSHTKTSTYTHTYTHTHTHTHKHKHIRTHTHIHCGGGVSQPRQAVFAFLLWPKIASLPRTRNSWPSTLASPLGFCSRLIQWCISSGVSAWHCSTRLAVMITKEFGLWTIKQRPGCQRCITVPTDFPNAVLLFVLFIFFMLLYRSGLSDAHTESTRPTSRVP